MLRRKVFFLVVCIDKSPLSVGSSVVLSAGSNVVLSAERNDLRIE